MASLFDLFLLFSIFLSCICTFSSFSNAYLLVNETDRLALLSFKTEIIIDPFNIMASWNASNHFCKWEGITCSHRHQRVSVLNLKSQRLVGQISPHIGNLSFLKTIDLTNNSLSGNIPQEIGRLFRLQVLHAANNSLQGNIPYNISLCSNLARLDLSFNQLAKKLPTELGSLSKLYFFSVRGNVLQGSIPPTFGNLTSLGIFDLGYNKLEGSIVHTIGQLKRLTFLNLGLNNLSGTLPLSFYNLSNLESFSAVKNNIGGTLPTNIGLMLPNIKELYIGGNQFHGSLPVSLFNASKLQSIDIAFNQFIGDISSNVGNLWDLGVLNLAVNDLGGGKDGDLTFMLPLTNCSNLRELSIGSNHFGGILPTSIANLSKQLNILDLSSNRFYGKIPSVIENLQNLYLLNLGDNLFTGTIPRSLGNMQKLQLLGIYYNQLSRNIPSSITNMSSLNYLDLRNNFLDGSISQTLKTHNLVYLILSSNKFTGTIPKVIHESINLFRLDLSNNMLNGSIPSEVGDLIHLNYFDMSNNSLSGKIPKTLADCYSLQYLYLNGNSFEGSLLSTLDNLKDLQELNVSHNILSGNIPKELGKLVSLRSLDLSFNQFEGAVPEEGIFQNGSEFSVVGNQKICGGISELDLPKCLPQQSRKPGTHVPLKLILGPLIPLIAVAMVLLIYLRKKAPTNALLEESPPDLWRVSYNDLHKATSGFSSANLLGTGRYGSVYKGVHREGNFIAVKVFNLREPGASKNFVAECEALRVVRHRNCLKIYTVCSSVDFSGNDFKALVFQFMPNGNLDSWLHQSSDGKDDPRSLNFPQRLSIALDIAFGLDYLHNHWEMPIVHCDLKSSNILLDEKLTAHVADFGLAKFVIVTNTTTASNDTESSSISIRGTIGYIPPEYGAGGKVSTQGDAYSFGILLLEMFTGRRPTDRIFKDGFNLHDFSRKMLPHRVMEIIDMSMLSDIHDESSNSVNQMEEYLCSIVRIGVACSVDEMTQRMSIKDALKELQSIKTRLPPTMES